MRDIINISLPPNLTALVRQEVKSGNYASTSEFFRHLIREWNTQQLAKQLKRDQKNPKTWKTLKSLRDLR